MPLSRLGRSLKFRTRIQDKIANASASNIRTQISKIPVLVEQPDVRPYNNTLALYTRVVTLADADWQMGDFFTLIYYDHPERSTPPIRVKFVTHDYDGIPWLTLIVEGAIDL